jgi:8-oxo-dGTP diphosphatase
VKEETGIEITNIRFLRLMNLNGYTNKHYVDVALVADWHQGEPMVIEPHKCDGWNWYYIDELPEPLFGTIASCIEAYKTGRNYFDF